MCFSPEIDVTAGVVVGAIGLETLRHVHRWRDVPLASLPVLFGAHQLTEAIVWWGLTDRMAPSVGNAALWAYVVFAFVILPVLAPLAAVAIEPDGHRRRIQGWFAVLGALVAWWYLTAMLDQPVSAAVEGHTLTYNPPGVTEGGFVASLYMVATVGALLASSHRRIAIFGVANLVALPLLTLIATQALTSLWCAWAAVSSIVIAAHFREGDAPDEAETRQPRSRPAAWRDHIHFRPHP